MRAPRPEPAELDIHPTVLCKIVEYVADSVPGTLRHERRLAGIDVGESGASARVVVGPGEPAPVDVRLELTLRYPARVRSVVEAVRAVVTDDLARWAGRRMRTLAVTVVGLHAAIVVGYVSAWWRLAELPRPDVRAGHTPPGEG